MVSVMAHAARPQRPQVPWQEEAEKASGKDPNATLKSAHSANPKHRARERAGLKTDTCSMLIYWSEAGAPAGILSAGHRTSCA